MPAKSALLIAAKRLLVHLHDDNVDEMFSLSDSKQEGVSHSQSLDPDQNRTARMFEKLEGAIKKQSASLKEPKQVGRIAGA